MTTATHTQGLQAMYSPVQQSPWAQWDLARMQTAQFPQTGQIPQVSPSPWQSPYQQFGQAQSPYQQQFGQMQSPYQQQFVPYPSPMFSAGLEMHLAAELFKLGQLVLSSAQQVGRQPGKPDREQIAYEIFRLGQLLQQAAVISPITPYAGQFGQSGPYGRQFGPQHSQQYGSQPGQFGQQQTPIWS